MKKALLFFLLLFAANSVIGQTLKILRLPKNCNFVNSVEDVKTDTEFLKVFPNPNNGVFYIELRDNKKISKAQVLITDILGAAVYSENIYCGSAQFIKQIKLPALPCGNYVLSICSNGKQISSLVTIKN